MKPYKKRAKSSWNCGKRGKQNSDCTERQFAKREIKTAMAEAEASYLERYHKGARTRNKRARLEYRIAWCEQTLMRYSKSSGYFSHYCESEIRKARAELKAMNERKEDEKTL